MDLLKNLPDRGCFGVMEGVHMQVAPVYVCCHDNTTQPGCIIRNGSQALHDLYKQSQKRHSAAAAAATKRQARQHLEDRSSKRQHQTAANQAAGDGGLEAALAAVAGTDRSCKTELVKRLLDYQRRLKKATQG
ncbi:hypothetical protein OEZ86_003147 [Tetradesmus obliquus]|nr:hypothetical protein OEZ86_003147 [Tetradesmus obliquus]